MSNTERDQLVAMLTRAKIEFSEEPAPSGGGEIEVIGGYSGFGTLFEFSADGQLLTVGAYEG